MTDSTLPADIDPVSGSRLPPPDPEFLDEEARRTYDQLANPEGGSLAGLRGPGGVRLHSPTVSNLTRPLNGYLRYETGISAQIRELAILVTAREHDSQFEWAAHEPEALRQGVSAEIIETVKHRRPIGDDIPPTEALIIRFGRELFRDHRVSSETFAQALETFGARKLVDLVSLMGMYQATASLLAAFDVQLHPGQEPLLPMP